MFLTRFKHILNLLGLSGLSGNRALIEFKSHPEILCPVQCPKKMFYAVQFITEKTERVGFQTSVQHHILVCLAFVDELE